MNMQVCGDLLNGLTNGSAESNQRPRNCLRPKAGATIEGRGFYVAKTASVPDAVQTFMNMQPQAIIVVFSGAAAVDLLEKYRIAPVAAQLLAHSETDIKQPSERLSPEQTQGVAIAQVTPSPYPASSQLIMEFTVAVAKTHSLEVSVSYAMMEVYIAVRVISEAVRRQGSRPSREGTTVALASMSSFDLRGYLISLKPGRRSGTGSVELCIVHQCGQNSSIAKFGCHTRHSRKLETRSREVRLVGKEKLKGRNGP